MSNMFLYFAYGSNMNPERMLKRCPGAIIIGGATLENYQVAERLYADIDFAEGAKTEGVIYGISQEHLRKLDRFEGYPSVYRRMWVDIEFQGETYQAVTYEMAYQTKLARDGKCYPDAYRAICSAGAEYYGIKNNFKK